MYILIDTTVEFRCINLEILFRRIINRIFMLVKKFSLIGESNYYYPTRLEIFHSNSEQSRLDCTQYLS